MSTSLGPKRTVQPRGLVARRILGIFLPIVIGAVAAACARVPGPYPFDILPEMHYQQSSRFQEPPRLSPPVDSVPITGKEIPYDFVQAGALKNPVPKTPETIERSKVLYQVNCVPCHGPEGRGDGLVAAYFARAKLVTPVDYTSDRARSRTDGQLFWFITNGLGNMPTFRNLLSEEERWTLVYFIRSVQGQ